MKYMKLPLSKVTIAGVEIPLESPVIDVTRRENGFDIGTLTISNDQSKNWTAKISKGDAITIEVKDRYGSDSYTKFLSGIIDVAIPGMSPLFLKIKCLGSGYGFGKTVCGQEYGTQSTNPSLDTIKEILTDATNGVVPKWVNKILGGATNSGYSYDTTNVEVITGSIKYVYFPFKPNHKVLGDLCDLVTALKAGTAGPHWIVDTDDKLRVKLISATQAGWTKYYGDSQANATVEQDKDFVNYEFQELDVEANYILYHGRLRKPATEIWTEGDGLINGSLLWDCDGNYDTSPPLLGDAGTCIVGSASLGCQTGDGSGPGSINAWYPSAKNAAWDITKWGGKFNIPSCSFYVQYPSGGLTGGGLKFYTSAGNYYYYQFGNSAAQTAKWYHYTFPLGPYAEEYSATLSDDMIAVAFGAPDWSDINWLEFGLSNTTPWNAVVYFIDGLYFNGYIIRVAKNSTSIAGSTKLRMKVVTDDVGKDDSGKAADDSGSIAQFAYKELLRCQSTPLVGMFQIPMVKDLLPGQLLHVHAEKKADGTFRIDKDMRVTKLQHKITAQNAVTNCWVTDDVLNSHPRAAFNDTNLVLSMARPEFQDRQATSIKTREIDISQAVLEKDYP